MRHACLAFMLVGDDGLGHVEQRGNATQIERERDFMDSNSSSFQSRGRVP